NPIHGIQNSEKIHFSYGLFLTSSCLNLVVYFYFCWRGWFGRLCRRWLFELLRSQKRFCFFGVVLFGVFGIKGGVFFVGDGMKTALIMAMKEEAKPVISEFGMTRFSLDSKCKWKNEIYESSKYPGFYLILNGSYIKDQNVSKVGTQAACVATFIALELLGAEMIINAGTAGGFASRGNKVGDVFLGKKAFYHDRRVPISKEWQAFARGEYSLHFKKEWFDKYDFLEGFISTGNSLDFVDRDLDLIHEFGAHAKEMEAAAIAEICEENNIPLICIKSITDIVDGGIPTHEEFMANLNKASEELSKHLLKFLGQEILIGEL
ncbi:MAG: hypothetical protein CL674_15020, partial [Bdellovibrionaceae bacterium]|nr:hypothetical protein [Pseudobdellovibrionaceae bacterium]